MQDAAPNHSTQTQKYPQSYYSPTENPLEKKVQEWQARNVLTTLSREERDKEYEQALIELSDFLDADLVDRSNDSPEVIEMMTCQSMRDLKRTKKELALRSYILTEEEEEEEENEAVKWAEKELGLICENEDENDDDDE
jgi:hypothetical protein